jgi:ferredoxin-thioredoxin reductase catalytic subunit
MKNKKRLGTTRVPNFNLKMIDMIQIFRKEGWVLNPKDKVVNAILKRCEKNEGLCPCVHDSEDYDGKDLHCPCTDYTIKGKCECGLYVKDSNWDYITKR